MYNKLIAGLVLRPTVSDHITIMRYINLHLHLHHWLKDQPNDN